MPRRIIRYIILSFALWTTCLSATSVTTSAQEISVCGWIEAVPQPTLFVWGTDQVIRLDHLSDEDFLHYEQVIDLDPGYYRIFDPVFFPPSDVLVMRSFSRIEKVSVCGSVPPKQTSTPTRTATRQPATTPRPTPKKTPTATRTPTAARTPVAKRSPTVTPTPTAQTFTVTWMEIAPQVPVQNQTAVVQVFLDNAKSRDAKYLTDFDGEIILRNSTGQVVERQAFDAKHNHDAFLPDAEAMKKDLFSRKWVLTVHQVRFKQWADTATLEVWLRPLGARSGTNVVKASMRLAVKADPDAFARCVSFVSKKLVALDLPIGDVTWVLVGTGTATRIGTCTTKECVALEIAQLAVKLGKAQAMQLLSVALRVANLQNVTGAADCYNLAQ